MKTYELIICNEQGAEQSIDFGEYEFYKLTSVAEQLIKRGLTVQIRLLDYE